jgi:hypothetical protein
VHYSTTAGNTGYYKINIVPADSWMISFTIRMYQGYESYDIRVSGYNYGSNFWYTPTASLMDSTTTSIDVRFGYDSAFNLWVAVPAGNYTGLDILNVVNGYTQFDGNYADRFTITNQTTLTGTVQATVTAYRPAKYNEALRTDNYNSYAPTLTGGGASGTWGINITGNAATITSQANSATTTAATAANGNQIVLRDANGDDYRRYGFSSYFNMSHGVSGATGDTIFYSSTDDYIRKNNATGFRASLNVPTRTGGDASGTWGINITGNAATATSADQIDGVGFRNTGSNSAVNADTIESNGISYYSSGVTNFSGNATDGGLYSQAYSSAWQHQIAGDYRSGQIAIRGKNSGTWQAWRTVVDSSNVSSYAITSLTDTLASVTGRGSSTTTPITLQKISWIGEGGNSNNTFSANHYSMGQAGGAWTNPYPDLIIGMHTGIRIGAHYNYRGTRFYNNSPSGTSDSGGGETELMSIGDGDNHVRVAEIGYAGNSFRAPIFYDNNDTTYYGDFASTSWLRHLSVGDVNATNDGGWNARLNLTGSTHARLDVKSNSDGIITTMYSHTGQGVGKVGTYSNHPLVLMAQGGAEGGSVYSGSLRSPLFYDSDNTAYYLDAYGESNINKLTFAAQQRFSVHYRAPGRSSNTTDQEYWTNTVGWGTGDGTWGTYWKFGFGGFDCWGSSTDHPQGSGYIHAQGIQSGLHAAAANGSTAYGWQMVGASNATDNRYWARGKWAATTSTWKEFAMYGGGGSGDLHAAAFYDSNDTAYYLDPNTTGTSLKVAGSIIAGGNITASSDIRLKEDIEVITDAIDKVKQITGVTYTRKENGKRQTGVIAQDVLKVLPEAVEGSEDSMYSVAYGNMVGLLIEAIKDQQTIIDSQESRITKLEILVAQLIEG